MSTVIDRLTVALAERYRLDRELGAGGMATVYLAHDVKHEREVAIKVLHPDLGAALGGERFLVEIKTTAKLQHPHILPLLDSARRTGCCTTSCRLCAAKRCARDWSVRSSCPSPTRCALPAKSLRRWSTRISWGSFIATSRPENILLQDGAAVVADFGIALAVQSAGGARMTQTGLSLGTPSYMSPEQAMGERTIDARSDIYALGAVTYEMLAGDPPFTGSTVQAVVAKVISAEPERLSLARKTVPAAVEVAVLTAIAKLPADRFASAAEFALALSAPHAGATSIVDRGARERERHSAALCRDIVCRSRCPRRRGAGGVGGVGSQRS